MRVTIHYPLTLTSRFTAFMRDQDSPARGEGTRSRHIHVLKATLDRPQYNILLDLHAQNVDPALPKCYKWS